jgi:hypothetical protein
MRANEFIAETDGEFDPVYQAAIKNAVKFPDQNPSTGSAYLNYRFGIALAGAPDYPTKAAGSISGDPLLSTYTDEELMIINSAAKMVGSKGMKRLSNNRSTELSNTNKTSPVPQNSGKLIKRKS